MKNEAAKPTELGNTIRLTDYGRKGIHAYVCPIEVVKGSVVRGIFINGVGSTEADVQRLRKGQSCAVDICIDGLNGFCEYKEANGHKASYGYLRIEDGAVVEEWDSKNEMVEAIAGKLAGDQKLPALTGSEKQISWAETIRAKRISALMGGSVTVLPDYVAIQTEAKWWIDNRGNF